MELGILSLDRQDGLVRTLGRSFARLAEWQVTAAGRGRARERDDPSEPGHRRWPTRCRRGSRSCRPRSWRRHLAQCRAPGCWPARRRVRRPTELAVRLLRRHRRLHLPLAGPCPTTELVGWLEAFESERSGLRSSSTTAGSSRTSATRSSSLPTTAAAAADIALGRSPAAAPTTTRSRRSAPGCAYGDVVTRLGRRVRPGRQRRRPAHLGRRRRRRTVRARRGSREQGALRRRPHASRTRDR